MKNYLSIIRIYIVLLMLLVLPFFTYLSIGSRGFEIGKVVVFIATTIILFVLSIPVLRHGTIHPLITVTALWICWNIICSVINSSLQGSVIGDQWYGFGLLTVGFLFGYMMLVSRVVTDYYLPFVFDGLIVTGIFHIVGTILFSPVTFTTRLSSTLGEPNWAGSILLISFISACAGYWHTDKHRNKFIMLSTIVLGIGIVLTGSRSAILAAIITTVCLPFMFNKRISLEVKTFGLLSILLLLFVGVITCGMFANTVSSSIAHSPVAAMRGMSGTDSRLWIYQKGLQLFLQRPVFGWGWEKIGEAYAQVVPNTRLGIEDLNIPRSHNIFLDMLISGGIVSTFLFISIIILSIYTGLQKPELVLILFSLLIYAQFNPFSISHWVILFFFFGMTARSSKSYKH